MGCGGSRDKADREIKSYMIWIPFAYDVNAFFSPCENLLETAEMLRAGFEDTTEIMHDLASTNYLKSPPPPTLIDAVKVWIWTLAANNEGDIGKCHLNADSSSPYLKVDLGNECSYCKNNPDIFHPECSQNQNAKFQKALQTYIKTCIEGVKQLPDLLKNLIDLAEKSKNLAENCKSCLDALSTLEKAKALSNIAKNSATLASGVSKLKNVQTLVTEAVKNMQDIVKQVPDILATANEVAKKAVDKKHTHLADVMQDCHPGDKYDAAQIKKLKEEAEKKRKQEEEEKKKKACLINKLLEAKKLLQSKSEKK
ncbi:hypothetical protein TTHERM_00312800 (macronuclear) [Tetrahymena thermophila SB210]|uniref:Uncharacterized protein n=1 Tax=Tetrahymena thermophila (strain SB210) TaxID=312017 RepID=Q22KK1_TETTS|nr:hypothetical protein TTHERM_00312800 [Tetrahymena thermophila SB210]EAR85798.1 hypothetical protein TTHERM_00312800 [Tetrahymena thermophila SB210]|eukprot:XP_001033461.1 hypothetical protein TTHERM_00312800 [Tetrahymena thermophila SB210]